MNNRFSANVLWTIVTWVSGGVIACGPEHGQTSLSPTNDRQRGQDQSEISLTSKFKHGRNFKDHQGPSKVSSAKLAALSPINTRSKSASSLVKGKVVVYDFWATWCRPCIDSIPQIRKLAEVYAGTDVEVVGIHVGDDRGLAARFSEAYQMEYPLYVDRGFVFSEWIGVRNLPFLLVVGRDGKVLDRSMKLDAHLLSVVREAASAPAAGEVSK